MDCSEGGLGIIGGVVLSQHFFSMRQDGPELFRGKRDDSRRQT